MIREPQQGRAGWAMAQSEVMRLRHLDQPPFFINVHIALPYPSIAPGSADGILAILSDILLSSGTLSYECYVCVGSLLPSCSPPWALLPGRL